MNNYGDCSFCGGEVEEKNIEYDYRRKSHLLIVSDVPAGVCRQCGEKYFKPGILKRMDQVYHDIFDRHQTPERVLEIPAVSFQR
ncbi:MAG: type II toxin-antitoxin system MqsA family antitoxin [Nitrospirae bacterium]|nr:type II toxin-antitoxin system MqsA family antitoxin [Nitrospirota bacterium]MDA1303578.1 type II toxin-antitoxin system MqsA family antitoxin [Nitrospirota bacterium]